MSQESLRGRDRNKRVALAFVASIASKAIAIGVTFVSVPIAYKILGQEQFSLWMTITSIYTATQFADLGIGNGLLNILAVANARDDLVCARRAVASSVSILCFLGVTLLTIFICLYPFLDWVKIYNTSTDILGAESGIATLIMVVCLVLNLPLLTAQRVQMGYQDGLKASLWISVGLLFSLVGVVVCSYIEVNLAAFILAALGGPVLAAALCWLYEFFIDRPWLFPSFKYFDWPTGWRVMKDGGLWSLFLFFGFIGTGLDNFVISHFFGVNAVAKYAVMSKLLTGLLVAQMLSAPLWPAFAEAVERGDLTWARKIYRRSMIICAGFGLAGGLAIIFFSPLIVKWWVGSELVPDPELAIGFALWCFITNFFAAISAMMANHRLLPALIRLTAIAAITSFGLKIFLVPLMGSNYVIWASVIGYGLIILPAIWMTNSLLNQ